MIQPATLTFKRFPWTVRDGRSLNLGDFGILHVVKSKNGETRLEIEVPSGVVVDEVRPPMPETIAFPVRPLVGSGLKPAG